MVIDHNQSIGSLAGLVLRNVTWFWEGRTRAQQLVGSYEVRGESKTQSDSTIENTDIYMRVYRKH